MTASAASANAAGSARKGRPQPLAHNRRQIHTSIGLPGCTGDTRPETHQTGFTRLHPGGRAASAARPFRIGPPPLVSDGRAVGRHFQRHGVLRILPQRFEVGGQIFVALEDEDAFHVSVARGDSAASRWPQDGYPVQVPILAPYRDGPVGALDAREELRGVRIGVTVGREAFRLGTLY